MSLFLAAIGPLGEPATTAWFLFPGDPEHPAVIAPTLAQALPELRRIAAGRDILCDPALAGEAAACGLATGAWTDPARADFAAIALDVENRSTMSGIEEPRLIGRFCEAFALLSRRFARGWPEGERLLSLGMPDQRQRLAMIIDGPGLVIFDAGHEDEIGEWSGLDGLAAVIGRGLAAVEDALGRAYGLAGVPQPFRLSHGQKHPVATADLLLLTDAMAAASRIGSDAAAGSGGLSARIVPMP